MVEIVLHWAVLIITVAGFIWKAAVMSSKIKNNEKAIKEAHKRLDDDRNKNDNNFNELSARITSMEMIQTRMEEKIIYIYERIKELKG